MIRVGRRESHRVAHARIGSHSESQRGHWVRHGVTYGLHVVDRPTVGSHRGTNGSDRWKKALDARAT